MRRWSAPRHAGLPDAKGSRFSRAAALARSRARHGVLLRRADWRSKIKPSPATRKYVAQIEKVAASDEPELLVGHLYSRYLGDLFGGQMMSGMALKTLGERRRRR